MRDIRDINRKHVEVITHVANNSAVKDELMSISETCKCRERWFHKLYSSNTNTEHGCEPDNCCCPPDESRLIDTIESFPKY